MDPGQPRQKNLPAKTAFRHYLNLKRMEKRLDQLLGDFRWDSMQQVFLAKPDYPDLSLEQISQQVA